MVFSSVGGLKVTPRLGFDSMNWRKDFAFFIAELVLGIPSLLNAALSGLVFNAMNAIAVIEYFFQW